MLYSLVFEIYKIIMNVQGIELILRVITNDFIVNISCRSDSFSDQTTGNLFQSTYRHAQT